MTMTDAFEKRFAKNLSAEEIREWLFSSDFTKYLKQQVPLLELAKKYVDLIEKEHPEKETRIFVGDCPLCKKEGSFHVNPKLDVFLCFSCHSGGDIITFVEKMESISPFEALKKLIIENEICLPNDPSVFPAASVTLKEKLQQID